MVFICRDHRAVIIAIALRTVSGCLIHGEVEDQGGIPADRVCVVPDPLAEA